MPKKKDNIKASSKKTKTTPKADSQKIIDDLKSKIENDNKNSILIDLNNINRIKKILGGIKNNNEK